MDRHFDVMMDHRGLIHHPEAVPVTLTVACEYTGVRPGTRYTQVGLVVTREEYADCLGYRIHQSVERCRRLNGAAKAKCIAAAKGNPDGTSEIIDTDKLGCGL